MNNPKHRLIVSAAFLALLSSLALHANIPSEQRQALIALYNSTNGDSWSHNTGWKTPPLDTDGFAMPGTEGSWYGVMVDAENLNVTWIGPGGNNLVGTIPATLGGLTSLQFLNLGNNQLSGSIPPELGNLTNLWSLSLKNNQLSGSIPDELGNVANLRQLHLEGNQLTESIPATLGNLSNLGELYLNGNQLSGSIPAELGALNKLGYLYVNSNKLSGAIPTSLANLTYLAVGCTDFGYNALYTSNEALITFLNSKDADWAATQTIAPTGVTATALDGAIILVSWLPITYTGDTGSYRVLISQTAGGTYTLAGETTDKTTSSVNVTGLTPGETYYFVVQTHTDAHANNLNIVESENSAEASAVAWMQINVHIAGTVTLGGSPLNNVLMSGLPGSPVTNSSGVYDVTVAAGWSGTVTPSLASYTFEPVSRDYATVTTDQTGQGYTATLIVPTITVTSPNGGETWAAGTNHDITWTQTDMTGLVTIDLYKGGVFQKILGTPEATAGTFTWTIVSTETAGPDYRVLVWQGSVSDESDANFTIVRKFKVDFNKDGQEDFLWRCYGTSVMYGVTGDGWDVVWFMGQTGALSPIKLAGTQDVAGAMNRLTGSIPGETYLNPMDVGKSQTAGPVKTYVSPMDVGNPQTAGPIKTVASPLDAGNRENTRRDRLTKSAKDSNGSLAQVNSLQTRTKDFNSDSVLQDMGRLAAGDAKTMALDYSSDALLYTVLDLAWEIAGAGDFDGDGNTDVLWRYYGTGQGRGMTVIWYMNGTTISSQGYPYLVSDTDWRIDRTGDFNGDGKADILWRYYGSGPDQGTAIIWCMDGATIIDQIYPYRVSDTDWKIDGIGDFNGDGKADILWRYYGTGPGQPQGMTVIWYMDGTTILSQGYPYLVSDTDWKVDGTGDFNGDGRADIVWRYYGTGDGVGTTIIWYMDGATIIGQDRPYRVSDTNWRIVNREPSP